MLLWRLLDWAQQIVMVAASVSIVTLILVQVVLRYFFRMPIFGVEELACLFGFWLYFIGAANGSRESSHIKADILNVFVTNERVLNIAKAVIAFITLVLSGIFIEWTSSYVSWSFVTWERSPSLRIPMVCAQASLFVSSILMFFYFAVEFVDYVRQARGYPPFDLTV
jgi:TRAP-type C4-dicarboxylate transport system permease small subunit